jgi:hypothetical protein
MKKPAQIIVAQVCKGGRDDWIRTSDLFVPNEARYRAALHPELHFWEDKYTGPSVFNKKACLFLP